MSLLLRRRALAALCADQTDGKYCYAIGMSGSYTNAWPWLYKSTDYGATWNGGIPLSAANHYFVSQSQGKYFSRLAVNDQGVCWISGSSLRYHYHETEIVPQMVAINSGSTGSVGSNWAARKNLSVSTGSFTSYTTYFGSRSGSATVEKTVGKYRLSVDSGWSAYENTVRVSPSASACSRDGQYAIVGAGNPLMEASVFTTDFGTTWQNVEFDSSSQDPTEEPVNDACMSADGRVVMLATQRGVVYSVDYMTTWKRAGTTPFFSCCITADGTRGWIASTNVAYGLREIDFSSGEWQSVGMIAPIVLRKIRCNAAGNKFIGLLSGSQAAFKGDRLVYSHMDSPTTWTTASVQYQDGETTKPYIAYCHDIVMSYSR